MKRTAGMLAGLLLAAAAAIGQQSPFPIAANPSLEIYGDEQAPPAVVERYQVDLPSSMASSTTSQRQDWVVNRHDEDRSYQGTYELPFPTAANPAVTNGTFSAISLYAESPLTGHHKFETGSAFPLAANPSSW
jgi:hypothetical protein